MTKRLKISREIDNPMCWHSMSLILIVVESHSIRFVEPLFSVLGDFCSIETAGIGVKSENEVTSGEIGIRRRVHRAVWGRVWVR